MKRILAEPTGDRILVKRDDPATEKNGFALPEQSIEKPSEGVIMAIGPKVALNNFLAQREAGYDYLPLGAKVIFGKYSGVDVTVNDGEVFVLLKADEIFTKLVEVSDDAPTAEPPAVQ